MPSNAPLPREESGTPATIVGYGLLFEAHFSHETNLRIDLDDAGQSFEGVARIIVERRCGPLAIRGRSWGRRRGDLRAK